jgi:hypothetical protein
MWWFYWEWTWAAVPFAILEALGFGYLFVHLWRRSIRRRELSGA